jgi:hypothetical protein
LSLVVHQNNQSYRKQPKKYKPRYYLVWHKRINGTRRGKSLGNAFKLSTWEKGYQILLNDLMDKWNSLTKRIQNLQEEVNEKMQEFFLSADLHFRENNTRTGKLVK